MRKTYGNIHFKLRFAIQKIKNGLGWEDSKKTYTVEGLGSIRTLPNRIGVFAIL